MCINSACICHLVSYPVRSSLSILISSVSTHSERDPGRRNITHIYMYVAYIGAAKGPPSMHQKLHFAPMHKEQTTKSTVEKTPLTASYSPLPVHTVKLMYTISLSSISQLVQAMVHCINPCTSFHCPLSQKCVPNLHGMNFGSLVSHSKASRTNSTKMSTSAYLGWTIMILSYLTQ